MVRLKFLSHYFTPTYGPGAASESNEIPKKIYKDALKPEDFEVYAKWLLENLPAIKKSYINMCNDSLKYPSKQLKTDNTVGPFKYGFILKGYWWTGIPQLSQLEDLTLIEFVGDLDNLQRYLQKILKSLLKPQLVETPDERTVQPQDSAESSGNSGIEAQKNAEEE